MSKKAIWSAAEDAIIAEEIARERVGWCIRVMARLPDRTINAIKSRAYVGNIMERVRKEHIREMVAAKRPARVQTGENIPDYLRDLPIWDKAR